MILVFPTEAVFRRALLGGFLPEAIRELAVKAQVEPNGPIRIETLKKHFGKRETDRLIALGATWEVDFPAGNVLTYPHLWMLLSVESAGGALPPTDNLPVLFELDDDFEARLTPEMLRLGNDRIAYYPSRTEAGTALLRVVGPPYYTFLRALETGAGTCRAFVEAAPRVWVQAGYRFAAAGHIALQPDQFLLAGPTREYRFLEAKPFVDLYERVHFQIPNGATRLEDRPLGNPLTVPVRLVAGDSQEPARLWIFRGSNRERFERWVGGEDERTLAKFQFAVGEAQGETVIAVQARPGKEEPPALPELGAEEYRPFWKLPNLFVPVGRRLQPMLRRDRVRELFLKDGAEIVWLREGPSGEFEPEVLAETAFHPLDQWVEYILVRDRQPLSAWLAEFEFEFDDFLCPDDGAEKPKPPAEPRGETSESSGPRPKPRVKPPSAEPRVNLEPAKAALIETPRAEAPSELRLRRQALEKQFLELAGPIESAERRELWPELAAVNGDLGEMAEAALCWANGAWLRDDFPADWLREWAAAEERIDPDLSDGPPTSTGAAAARIYAARILRDLATPERPVILPTAMAYFEENDRLLPIRLAWLLWRAMLKGAGADILRLARVRDRLLERLRLGGLNVERDLPIFLRYGEAKEGERLRAVRLRLERVRETAATWHGKLLPLNAPYIDLIFAYGMARLGQDTTARERMHGALQVLASREIPSKPVPKKDEVAPFLGKAFAYRIEAAIDKKPTNDSFPESFARELEAINKRTAGKSNYSTDCYAIARLIEQLRILSPNGSPDPYDGAKTHAPGSFRAELEQLDSLRDRDRVFERVRRLLGEAARDRNAAYLKVIVLADSLPHAARCGEEFALDLLRQVPAALSQFAASPAISDANLAKLAREKEIALQQRALYLAGHFNQPAAARELFNIMVNYLKSKRGNELPLAFAQLTRGALRGVRKLGLRAESLAFLDQVYGQLVPMGDLAKAKAQSGKDWPTALAALLPLAEMWQALDRQAAAEPILAEARLYLYESAAPVDYLRYVPVAQSYIAALGESPPAELLLRVDELFLRIAELPNNQTTSPWYSRFHLAILEETVRTLVGDDQSVGPEVRRWLEDDEFLVRQRIHRDMEGAMA